MCYADGTTALLLTLSVVLSGCVFSPQTHERNMHIYIVHGYSASPSEHWFPWLKEELEQRGAAVSIVDLPSPNNPQPDEWQKALENQVSELDRTTYFVTHSLGSIALLRYLESATINERIGGYILVSGFNGSLPTLPQLDSFKKIGIDYKRLVQITGNRVVIAALDDASVPHALTEKLAESLDANFISVERGGHFLDSDGFTEFPLLLSEFENFINTGQCAHGRMPEL